MYRKRIPQQAFLAVLVMSVFAMAPVYQAIAQTAPAAAPKGKPSPTPTPMPTPPYPVTSTVYNFDAGSVQALMRSDAIYPSEQATYSTIKASKGPGNFVTSSIDQTGGWYLALSDQSGRSLWITPNQKIDTEQPAAPPAGPYVIQKAYSKCRDVIGIIVTYPTLVNGSGNCSMAVNFFYGGILYKLLMGPQEPDQGTTCPSGVCPATGLAKVVCNTATNSQCVNWTITPNDAVAYGVSNLYSYTGPSGAAWVFIGQYYNTFRINVSNP